MGFLPNVNLIDIDNLGLDDLESLKKLLLARQAMTEARLDHIKTLLDRIEKAIRAISK